MSNFNKVGIFMKTFGQDVKDKPSFSTDKIRAYFDHIPLTNGIGETTIEDIDLGLIDRVEVIKGPNSSIFGAGLGGVINLKPTLADYQKTTLSVSAFTAFQFVFWAVFFWRLFASLLLFAPAYICHHCRHHADLV